LFLRRTAKPRGEVINDNSSDVATLFHSHNFLYLIQSIDEKLRFPPCPTTITPGKPK
jgi:hypothetical protein